MTALLPEEAQEEIPVGFAIVGHVGMGRIPLVGDALLTCFSTFEPSRRVSPI